jgi:hypothetical protein
MGDIRIAWELRDVTRGEEKGLDGFFERAIKEGTFFHFSNPDKFYEYVNDSAYDLVLEVVCP